MIIHIRNYLFLLCLIFVLPIQAQQNKTFGKYDYLHGKLNTNRTWFNVGMYDIKLTVLPQQKFIQGSNRITYKVLKPSKLMQLDLHGFIRIDSIVYHHRKLSYTRDSSVVLIKLPERKKNSVDQITIYFSGKPLVARKAPWDGGFVFTQDSFHRPWVGLAVQGLGASAWLPCKDHNSDEADSVYMDVLVPDSLVAVSNGKFKGKYKATLGLTGYQWQVHNPINNYNITVNVGYYKHLSDTYKAQSTNITTPLHLDYYVLDYNYQKAQKHFAQVKPMLACYEKYFGPYPFWNDGYKLVETPYWGMEHQSCVSYGNDYTNNRWDFDFIIIHESAHEWFGNSLTSPDPAELWLHESFTTYAESVFIECNSTKENAQKYLKMQKRNIENEFPMLGVHDVYFHHFKDNDIYYKGAWMLHTLRHVVDNDTLWFNTLFEYSQTFKRKLVTTKQCMDFFSKRLQLDLTAFFTQYITKPELPVFEYIIQENALGGLELKYRWNKVVKGFAMPIKVTLSKNDFQFIIPETKWHVADLNYLNKADFKVLTDYFLISTKELKTTN